jgi:peroxiredoxin/mono/diheme cytochrome c family protein
MEEVISCQFLIDRARWPVVATSRTVHLSREQGAKMRNIWLLAGLALIVLAGSTVRAAENAAASAASKSSPIGRKVESFSLSDYRGKIHSLDELKDSKLLVIAVVGAECPLAKVYAPRLEALAGEFKSKGVAFLAIDSNVQDSLSEIAAYARIHKLTFPVLKDTDNKIADKLGATRTPEVFALDRDRVIRYWGRIDDQYGFKTGAGYARPRLARRDLAEALDELLASKPVSQPVIAADGCFIGRVRKAEPHGEITYSKQIARILQNRCVECHRAGEVAPFVLTSYDEVVAWAETIREVVDQGRMPPWSANPQFGHFSNDARLTSCEKHVISMWVNNGCPQGDPKDLPAPREFVEGWRIGEPDQVIAMRDKPYKVPAEGVVAYQFFTVDPGWKEAKWVKAADCRPGNRAIVHHIIVFIQSPGEGEFRDGGGLGGYAPGAPPTIHPEGTATYVPANSKLVFQLHYTPNGSEQEDLSKIGVIFADPKTVKKRIRSGLVGDLSFKIPPGADDYEIHASHKFLKEALLLDLTPHMHLRGKSFRFEAEFPDGRREILLDVPKYDFNWQLTYHLAEPKLIPKGTRMHCTAHYDNSEENLANPNPKETVRYGDQTWEEMMFGFYTTVDPKQDLTAAKPSTKPAEPKAAEAKPAAGG